MLLVLRAVFGCLDLLCRFTFTGRMLLFAFWISCRMSARQCPACGEKWLTELVGEWDGEDWHCASCSHYWNRKYDE